MSARKTERTAAIVAQWNAGIGSREIAAAFDMPRGSVMRVLYWARQRGITVMAISPEEWKQRMLAGLVPSKRKSRRQAPETLRRAIEICGSQSALARATGLPNSTIQSWQRRIPEWHISAVAKATGLPSDWLRTQP